MYHEKEAYPFLFWLSQFCPDTTRFWVCIKINKWTKRNIIQHSVIVFNASFPFASLSYKAFHWICVKVFGGIYCRFDSNHAFLVLRSIISRHKVLVPSIISIHFRHRVIKLFFLSQAKKVNENNPCIDAKRAIGIMTDTCNIDECINLFINSKKDP